MYPISQAKILKHAPAKLCISENWKKNNKVIDKEKAFLVAVWKGEGRKKKARHIWNTKWAKNGMSKPQWIVWNVYYNQ